MLFENYYKDARGTTRSAGVAEYSVSEVLNSIKYCDLATTSCIYYPKAGELFLFFSNGQFLYCIGNDLQEFYDNIPDNGNKYKEFSCTQSLPIC
jgi:hypothetical protein